VAAPTRRDFAGFSVDRDKWGFVPPRPSLALVMSLSALIVALNARLLKAPGD